MAYNNITSNTTTQVASSKVRKVKITINNGWTGTIVVIDNTAGSTPLVGTITNPATGQSFEYYSFQTGVRITTTGTLGDITVNADSSFGPL